MRGHTQALATVLAAAGIITLAGCGGSSESKGGSGSSSSSSSSLTARTPTGEVVASVGKTVSVPSTDAKLTVKKVTPDVACPHGQAAPSGQHYVALILSISADDPSKPIGLEGNWKAKTPHGEKPIVGLVGEMCHKPADQFPVKLEGKKSHTGERIFLVPKDATAVTLPSALAGSSLTLPMR